MIIRSRTAFVSGTTFGALAVILGAFGAHALKSNFNDYQISIWQTAVEYQMYHALVLMFTALLNNDSKVKYAIYLFLIGTIIFSGSLYALALSGVTILGAITPIGGACLIAAWLLLTFSFKSKKIAN